MMCPFFVCFQNVPTIWPQNYQGECCFVSTAVGMAFCEDGREGGEIPVNCGIGFLTSSFIDLGFFSKLLQCGCGLLHTIQPIHSRLEPTYFILVRSLALRVYKHSLYEETGVDVRFYI